MTIKNQESRINEEITKLKDKFSDMPDSYIQDINNLLIAKPNDENEKALKDVKLENTNLPNALQS